MCPKGDDPITINQNNLQILLTVSGPQSQAQFTGVLGIVFFGEISVFDMNSPSSSDCTLKLQTNPYFGTIGCTYTYINNYQIQYVITFLTWPMNTKENNLHYHDGNPAISDFFCDTSLTSTGVTCKFTNLVSSNLIGMHNLSTFFFNSHLILLNCIPSQNMCTAQIEETVISARVCAYAMMVLEDQLVKH